MGDGLRAALAERDAAEEQRRFLVTAIAQGATVAAGAAPGGGARFTVSYAGPTVVPQGG
jgi:hypothetical protein